MNLFNFNDRIIMVTGASSGIGRAVAIQVANLGATVIICGRNPEKLEETKKLMNNSSKHLALNFDVNDYENYNKVFDEILVSTGKLSGLIHCAGIADATPLRGLTLSKINEILYTNFVSFSILVSMYSKKKYSDGGSIIGVSAINAHYPQKYMSIYAASKSAMEAFVKTTSLELYEKNIRINCIAPGAVSTSMISSIDPDMLSTITERHLAGLNSADDIANVIIFMLSDASSAITGRTICADGGRLGQ